MVAVGAVLALGAALTGRACEARSALTHARAVHAVQADPVSKADVLGLPRAGLALGTKEARTAFSRLKRRGKAGLGRGPTSISAGSVPDAVWKSCWWGRLRARSLDRAWRAREQDAGSRTPGRQARGKGKRQARDEDEEEREGGSRNRVKTNAGDAAGEPRPFPVCYSSSCY